MGKRGLFNNFVFVLDIMQLCFRVLQSRGWLLTLGWKKRGSEERNSRVGERDCKCTPPRDITTFSTWILFFFAWFCRVLLDVHCTQHLPGTFRTSKQICSKDLTKDERKDLALGDLFDKSQRKTNLRIRVKSLDTCHKILQYCQYFAIFPQEKKHRVLGQSFT